MTSGHASMHTGGDLDWALGMYGLFARGGDDESMTYLQVDGDPWSKARPKFARRGKGVKTYQPTDDRNAEARLRAALSEDVRAPFPGNVMLACRFYRANFQRIDTDNLLKHVCDAANGVLWLDDSQVTLVLGEVLYDPAAPRTIIVAGNHHSTLLRGDDRRRPCDHCDELFLPAAGRAVAQRFCSRECAYLARAVVLVPVPCPVCGVEFKPGTTAQQLCSPACRAERVRGQRKARSRALSNCEACGKQLAHHRGGRCRDCWRSSPGFYADPLPMDEVVAP